MTKILFLDLDGTVRQTKSGATFISDPYDQELIPGVENSIDCYRDAGWLVIGVTNQGGVLAGHKTLENCFLEQRQTLKLIPQMSMLLFCTNNGDSMYRYLRGSKLERPILSGSKRYGNFRKPNPGMFIFGLGYFDTDEKPEQALMVGDRIEDQQAASNANIQFMWAEEWRKQKMLG